MLSLTNLLRWLGCVLAIAILGDALGHVIVHLRDLSAITHISGIWMALAQSLRDGVLYPPLQQDGYYAGTRYMPLYFTSIALLETLTGDYLLAAKLASLLAMVGLLAAVFAATWRIGGNPSMPLFSRARSLLFQRAGVRCCLRTPMRWRWPCR